MEQAAWLHTTAAAPHRHRRCQRWTETRWRSVETHAHRRSEVADRAELHQIALSTVDRHAPAVVPIERRVVHHLWKLCAPQALGHPPPIAADRAGSRRDLAIDLVRVVEGAKAHKHVRSVGDPVHPDHCCRRPGRSAGGFGQPTDRHST